MEKLKQYLLENFDILLVDADDPDDDVYYDRTLEKLIEEYGQEQRKEGYKKGFEDGENADG